MQASKIKIHQEYAIFQSGRLWRFWVNEVVTTRFQNTGSPHDFKSVVVGRIVETNSEVTLLPDALKGPYEEYAELVERRRQEEAEREREKLAKQENAEQLVRRLYALTGVPIVEGFNAPFSMSYSHRVEINSDGIAALLEKLPVA